MPLAIGLGIGLTITRRNGAADITAPTITSANSANNPEDTVLAHALTANEAVTWTITGGADAAKFEISGSTLRWASNGVKDYETPDDADTNNTYVVQVTATDAALNATNQTITITVTDVVGLVTPTLEWSTGESDPTPDFDVTLDNPQTADVLDLEWDDDIGFGSLIDTDQVILTADQANLIEPINFVVGSLANGTYYFRLKHTRGADVSSYSTTETVTINVASGSTPTYYYLGF